MSTLARLLPAILLLAIFLCPTETRADTVVITGGTAVVFDPLFQAGSTFTLTNSGAGFSVSGGRESGINGSFSTGSITLIPASCCGGSATLNGSTFQIVNWQGSQMTFMSAPFTSTLPDPGTGALFIDVQTAFTMEGTLIGFTPAPGGGITQVLDTFVVGQGTATLRYQLNYRGIPGYLITNITYNFEPTPVPEPATLLLLGTGLAGAAASRRRRRRIGRAREQ